MKRSQRIGALVVPTSIGLLAAACGERQLRQQQHDGRAGHHRRGHDGGRRGDHRAATTGGSTAPAGNLLKLRRVGQVRHRRLQGQDRQARGGRRVRR